MSSVRVGGRRRAVAHGHEGGAQDPVAQPVAAPDLGDHLALRAGVELTLKQLVSAFEKSNLVEIHPLEEKFDPHRHQAISQIEADGEPNRVINVLQKGYVLNERVIRPALVVVSKARAAPAA